MIFEWIFILSMIGGVGWLVYDNRRLKRRLADIAVALTGPESARLEIKRQWLEALAQQRQELLVGQKKEIEAVAKPLRQAFETKVKEETDAAIARIQWHTDRFHRSAEKKRRTSSKNVKDGKTGEFRSIDDE